MSCLVDMCVMGHGLGEVEGEVGDDLSLTEGSSTECPPVS